MENTVTLQPGQGEDALRKKFDNILMGNRHLPFDVQQIVESLLMNLLDAATRTAIELARRELSK